jgi:hypothetical protein
MAIYKNINITENFLNKNTDSFFVFGDNLCRMGYGGAAILRDHPNSIGFVTKKFPDNRDSSFYTVDEYKELFFQELSKLKKIIEENQNKMFYISKLGAGLANKYRIWEGLIDENIVNCFSNFNNVVFCWEN